MPYLNIYDADYYLGWARRTSLRAKRSHALVPWLSALCERVGDTVVPLLMHERSVIHGEYYPENILLSRGTVYPVDWESAAIAAPEIDLASLTEGWSNEQASECQIVYQRARWPDGSPADFERRLAAARLYLHLRWLGGLDEERSQTIGWHYENLYAAGERLGLLSTSR